MDSSTSPSDSRTVAGWVLLALVFTMAASAYYTVRVNPEVLYFRHIKRTQQAWAAQARNAAAPAAPVVAVAGGSGTGAAIRAAEASESLGVPVLNLGLGAGMGAQVIGEAALAELRSGDTLVLALEPALLSGDLAPPPLGIQFAWCMGSPEWIHPDGRWAPVAASALQLRPGARHLTSLLAKLALRRPLYRYQQQQVAADGSVLMREAREFPGEDSSQFRLSDAARRWLDAFIDRCEARGVRCLYTLPMIYCDEREAASRRRDLEGFLDQVGRHLPVVRTASLGINTRREDFADTPYHPYPAATVEFTREVVRLAQQAAPAARLPSP